MDRLLNHKAIVMDFVLVLVIDGNLQRNAVTELMTSDDTGMVSKPA